MSRELIYRGLRWRPSVPNNRVISCAALIKDENRPRYVGEFAKTITLRRTAQRNWARVMSNILGFRWPVLVSFDGVPWEIHQIADEKTYREALAAFNHHGKI